MLGDEGYGGNGMMMVIEVIKMFRDGDVFLFGVVGIGIFIIEERVFFWDIGGSNRVESLRINSISPLTILPTLG
jgi:hypothetical protein